MNRILAAILAVMVMAGVANAADMRITVTAGGKTLHATLEDNPASRALYDRLPLTLMMDDLYDREMCYNLEDALPASRQVSDSYKVGDIIYWPPRRSLVILYRQNGERFSRQYLGHIDEGVEMFESTGDIEVTFAAE